MSADPLTHAETLVVRTDHGNSMSPYPLRNPVPESCILFHHIPHFRLDQITHQVEEDPIFL